MKGKVEGETSREDLSICFLMEQSVLSLPRRNGKGEQRQSKVYLVGCEFVIADEWPHTHRARMDLDYGCPDAAAIDDSQSNLFDVPV